jgi:hypothetical protein
MIGRALDTMLSPLQKIARDRRRSGEDSLSLVLVDTLRDILLPVEKKRYWTYTNCCGKKTNLVGNEWSIYDPTDWEIKRECARAFEKRKEVNVGNDFEIIGKIHTGFGVVNKKMKVKRIEKNVVAYRGHLISSSESTLLNHKDEGYIPILYKGVIW